MNNTHSLLVGYILWIFGFTGAHRFYYGKPLTGTLWLCTFGLLGIGWFIDLFLMPGMDAAADRRYKEGPLDYSVAWILLTFFGLFGVHRMYLGKLATGIMCFLVSAGCAVGVWFIPPIIFLLPFVGLLVVYDFWTLNGQIDEVNRRAI
jgi:TM2 domain-containing membrane protein YozV